MKAFPSCISRIPIATFAGILFLFPRMSMEAEFVLMNRIISWDVNAQDAFWSIMPDASMPSNWLTPDNYYNGLVYSRYEIISVATNTPCAVGWGFFQWRGTHRDSCGELCESAPTLTGVGSVGYKTSSPSSWWQDKGGVDFSKISDMQSMGPVIYSKNPGAGNGWPVGKPGQGGDPGGVAWSDRYLWFTLTVRVTVIAVSEGSTFSGWDNYVPNPDIQKPAPTYGIDFINETTDKAVPSTDEFSEFPTMYGVVSGTGAKIGITPGRDAYFRTKAGDGLRRSEIQHFDIPCRPATPTFVLDKVNHRTTTVVSSDYEYSDFADMSDALTGTGTYVNIPAGTTKYFRKKANIISFKSNVQALNESAVLPIAHEFLIFNGMVDYPNTTDTNGFYYFYYNADMPGNWTSPEDYYHGQIYTRYEIVSEKTSTPIGLQFGLWQLLPPETGELHETMATAQTLNGPGSIVTANSSPSTWWKLDGGFDFTQMDLTWHMGINPWKMDPLYGYNQQIRQENPSVWTERNTYWFPMKVHVTVVAVASGYSFSGWNNYIGIKPPLPAYSINFLTCKTNQAVPATDEYSYSLNMSPAYSGTGVAIDVQPGQTLYFRTKAQGANPVSDIQRVIIPARHVTPAYTVDFAAEKTAQVIALTDEYSYSADMTGSTTGNNVQLNVTPGTNVYFQTRGTESTFASEVQTLVVPVRPDPPLFAIDYEHCATIEIAGTDILYSYYNNLSDPHYGTGVPVLLDPGHEIFFKHIPTGSSFCSGISQLSIPARNFLGYSGADTITQNKFTMYAMLLDNSPAFTLNDLLITNGTAGNLRQGNVFDVYPAATGQVIVVIPANTITPNSFASNMITVYYNGQATGMDELNDEMFQVYPNPAFEGRINVQIPSAGAVRLDIFNANGRFVKTETLRPSEYQTIDMQDMRAGMYLLKIYTNTGVRTLKVVLE